MLERLNQILERLDVVLPSLPQSDGISTNYSLSAQSQDSFSRQFAQILPYTLSDVSPTVRLLQAEEDSTPECMRIPTMRVASDAILMWPIFEGRYPPEYLVQEIFSLDSEVERPEGFRRRDGPEPPNGSRAVGCCGVNDDEVPELVNRFLTRVHIKNPILDVGMIMRSARKVSENGPGWDGESCLVVSCNW
jgi:hypothetical protein